MKTNNVFKCFLNVNKIMPGLIDSGKLFHAEDAVWQNALSPN